MGKYVPKDWTGPVTTCDKCGNRAPDVSRTREAGGPRECSMCFIGRVLNECVSEDEARALRSELFQEIRQPTVPWKSTTTQPLQEGQP